MPASLSQNYSLCSSVDVALEQQPPAVLIASHTTEGIGKELINSAEQLNQLWEKYLQLLFSLQAMHKCSTLFRALTGSIQTAYVVLECTLPVLLGTLWKQWQSLRPYCVQVGTQSALGFSSGPLLRSHQRTEWGEGLSGFQGFRQKPVFSWAIWFCRINVALSVRL